MGVDVTHIIRHNFHNGQDIQACKKFVINTAYKLKTQLHDEVFVRREDVAWKAIEERGWEQTLLDKPEDNWPAEFSIHLNRYNCRLFLRDGFWQLDPPFHYCVLVMHPEGRLWLRDVVYDIAHALGENEVWHADEYHTWNSGEISIETITFEEWLAYARNTKDGIKEFDAPYWLSQDRFGECIPPIFHDSFADLEKYREELNEQCGAYDLCGIIKVDGEYVVSKDGKVFWMNIENGEVQDYNPRDFDNNDLDSDVENYVTED